MVAAISAPNWKQVSRADGAAATDEVLEDRVVDKVVCMACDALNLTRGTNPEAETIEGVETRITDALALPST
eukprot:5514476-Amphidinium_carterae.1